MLLTVMFCAGVALALLERRVDESSELKKFVDKPVTLTGVLDGPPEFARDRVYLSIRVERVDAEAITRGRVSLLAPVRNAGTLESYRALQLRYGARVSVRTTLDRTGNYRNPGVSPLHEYLDRKGYDATGIVRGPGSIARLEDARVFPLLAKLYQWRERLQASTRGSRRRHRACWMQHCSAIVTTFHTAHLSAFAKAARFTSS